MRIRQYTEHVDDSRLLRNKSGCFQIFFRYLFLLPEAGRVRLHAEESVGAELCNQALFNLNDFRKSAFPLTWYIPEKERFPVDDYSIGTYS